MVSIGWLNLFNMSDLGWGLWRGGGGGEIFLYIDFSVEMFR